MTHAAGCSREAAAAVPVYLDQRRPITLTGILQMLVFVASLLLSPPGVVSSSITSVGFSSPSWRRCLGTRAKLCEVKKGYLF